MNMISTDLSLWIQVIGNNIPIIFIHTNQPKISCGMSVGRNLLYSATCNLQRVSVGVHNGNCLCLEVYIITYSQPSQRSSYIQHHSPLIIMQQDKCQEKHYHKVKYILFFNPEMTINYLHGNFSHMHISASARGTLNDNQVVVVLRPGLNLTYQILTQ